jgi:hypothetical protein
MTVTELIEKLKALPGDAPVIYQFHSDWAMLDAEGVTYTASESKRLVIRGGIIRDAYPEDHYPKGEKPVYVSAVCLPGN